jgi:predicted deacylase
MPDLARLRSYRDTLPGRPLSADATAPGLAGAGGLRYRGHAELIDAWLDAADRGARVRIIGATVEHAPVVALEIGPEIAPASSVILAGVHPLEWIGVEAALALLARLCAEPPENRCITLVPLVNVDGYRRVEADLRAGRRRWRRYNTHGVDLNRNWPSWFRGPSSGWAGRLAGSAGLAGLAKLTRRGGAQPWSEPETAAVAGLLDRLHARAPIDVATSLHSFGRMLLVPYGGRWRPPRRAAELHAMARAVAARLVPARRYRVRQVSRWLPGFFARGLEIDTLHDRYGALSLLVECGGGGLALAEPASWLQPFRWYNPIDPDPEVRALCDALEPLVRGDVLAPARDAVRAGAHDPDGHEARAGHARVESRSNRTIPSGFAQ